MSRRFSPLFCYLNYIRLIYSIIIPLLILNIHKYVTNGYVISHYREVN